MDHVQALNKCAMHMGDRERYDLVGEFKECMSADMETLLSENVFIHIACAISWTYGDSLSEKQKKSKAITIARKAKTNKNPSFEEGVHWCTYTPSGKTGKQFYLTTRGFIYWAMGLRCAMEDLIRCWSAEHSAQSIVYTKSDRLPSRKRKMDHITSTPIKRIKRTRSISDIRSQAIADAMDILNRERENNSMVYFICDGARMKIGLTRAGVGKRVKQLQTGNASGLEVVCTIKTPNPHELEAYLHEVFKNQNIRGEWFAISKEEALQVVAFLDG